MAALAELWLLAVDLVNPEAPVQRRNLPRHERTGSPDLVYLRRLSSDATPALDSGCAGVEPLTTELELRCLRAGPEDGLPGRTWSPQRERAACRRGS